MDFRKIFFVFTLLIFGNWVIGQMDSTDLNFYSTTLEFSSVEDSLDHFGIKSKELHLDLNFDLIENEEKVFVEIVQISSDESQNSIFSETYVPNQIGGSDLVNNGELQITIGLIETSSAYVLSFWIEDAEGHHIVWISKTLAQ